MPNVFFNLFLSFLSISSCVVSKNNATTTLAKTDSKADSTVYPLAYTLNQPDETLEMAADLVEISALSLAPNPMQLLTLQDEQGIIYFLNKKTGAIEKKIPFKEDGGDFEGVELVGNTIYAVRSKGKIYAIKDFENATPSIETYETGLTKESDVEGLGYDAKRNALLLTCKGKTNDDFRRSVYGFDLKTKQLSTSPLFEISLDAIRAYLKKNGLEQDESFKKFTTETPTEFAFGPSAIATHPISGDYYVLSSIGKTLAILSPTGTILRFEKLNKTIHAQPEGIVFDTDGTLYISNEGKKSTGKIMRYSMMH